MNQSEYHSLIYEKILAYITKNKFYIILIILIEIIPIVYDSIRISYLILDQEYNETKNQLNYYLKYGSINILLENLLVQNTTLEYAVTTDQIEVFYYKEFKITYSIICFSIILLVIIVFNIFILIQLRKQSDEEYILKKVITNSNNSISITVKNTTFLEVFFANIFEFIFHIFGSTFIEIFVTNIILALSLMFFYASPYVEIFNFLIAAMGFLMFCIIYAYYIININITINFKEKYDIHYDKFFSCYYDFFIFYIKIYLAIEKGLSYVDIANKTHLNFFRIFYSVSVFICLLKLLSRVFYQDIIFLINKEYNVLRIFFVCFLSFIFISQYAFSCYFEFSIGSLINFIFIILISFQLTYYVDRKNFLILIRNNQYLIYQLAYILDKYTLNDLKNMNEFILKLLIFHRGICNEEDCEIKNLSSVTIESVFEAFHSEIFKAKSKSKHLKGFYSEKDDLELVRENNEKKLEANYLINKNSHRKYLKADNNLEFLMNITYFFSHKAYEQKLKIKDFENFYKSYELEISNISDNYKSPIGAVKQQKKNIQSVNKSIALKEDSYLNENNLLIPKMSSKKTLEKIGKNGKRRESFYEKNKDKRKSTKENIYKMTLTKLFKKKKTLVKNPAPEGANSSKDTQDINIQSEFDKHRENSLNDKDFSFHLESFNNNKTQKIQQSGDENAQIQRVVSKEFKKISNERELNNYFKEKDKKKKQKTLMRSNNSAKKPTVINKTENKKNSLLDSPKHEKSNPASTALLNDIKSNSAKKSSFANGNVIKIMYNSYKFLKRSSSKKNIDLNIRHTISIILKQQFIDNPRQFINYKLLMYYIDIFKDIQQACDLLNRIIELFNSERFAGIFEISAKLCFLDLKIQKLFGLITLPKNKSYFSDIYSLYIIKYLFEETFNKELESNNNLIFSPDINKLIVENYNSDNFIILKSAKIASSDICSTALKSSSDGCNRVRSDKRVSYIKETFTIIKGTKFFIQNLNKNIDNLFPQEFKNEITENFVYSVYESNGISFNFKTVLEIFLGNIATNNNNNLKETSIVNDINTLLNNGSKSSLSKRCTEKNQVCLNENIPDQEIIQTEKLLKTAKFNCRIFPSFDISNVIILIDVIFYEDETIIFEQELNSSAKLEHLNNFSALLSNLVILPHDVVKSYPRNKIAFDQVFHSRTLKTIKHDDNNQFLKIIAENKSAILNEYDSTSNRNEYADYDRKLNFFGEIENKNTFVNGSIGSFLSYEINFTKYLIVLKRFFDDINSKVSDEGRNLKIYKQATINENRNLIVDVALFDTINIGKSLFKVFQVKNALKETYKQRTSTTNFFQVMDYFKEECSVEMSMYNSLAPSEKLDSKSGFSQSANNLRQKNNTLDKRFKSQKIKKFLILILGMIGIFIIAAIVLFVLGWKLVSLLNENFLLSKNYNLFSTHFYNTHLSIFIDTNIYFQNSADVDLSLTNSESAKDYFSRFYNSGVDRNVLNFREFLKKEFIQKLEVYKSNSQNFKNLVYTLSDKELRDKILNRKIKMLYITNTKNKLFKNKRNLMQIENSTETSLQISSVFSNANSMSIAENQVSFFDMVDRYLSYYKIMADKSANETINFYLVNNYNDSISFEHFFAKDIQPHQAVFYQLILNYENIYRNFEYIRVLLETSTQQFLESFKNLIVYSSFSFMGMHLLLIGIFLITLRFFDEIIRDNIYLMDSMLYKEKKDLLKNQFKELKQLSLLYARNPYSLIKNLKKEKQKLHEITSKKIKEGHSYKAGFYSNKTTSVEDPPAQDKNNKQIIFNSEQNTHKFAKLLLAIFVGYYFYSILMHFLFLSFQSKTIDSYQISNLGPYLYQVSINNAIFLTLKTILNQTDFKITKLMNAATDNANINIDNINSLYGSDPDEEGLYLKYRIKSIYEKMEEFKIILMRNSLKDLINEYYFNSIDCHLIYIHYGDSMITKFSDEYRKKVGKNSSDYETNFVQFCEYFPFMNIHSLYSIYEELTYKSSLIYDKLDESDRQYNSLKRLYENSLFKDVYNIIILILRPIREYINKNLNAYIVQNSFDNYFSFVIIYLALNFLVDFIILLMTYKNVIRNVNEIHENFEVIMNCLKH